MPGSCIIPLTMFLTAKKRPLIQKKIRPGIGIDMLRFGWVSFGLVHGSVSGRIHNHIGMDLAHQLADMCDVFKIRLVFTHRNQFTQRGQCALQFPANLSILAE